MQGHLLLGPFLGKTLIYLEQQMVGGDGCIEGLGKLEWGQYSGPWDLSRRENKGSM